MNYSPAGSAVRTDPIDVAISQAFASLAYPSIAQPTLTTAAPAAIEASSAPGVTDAVYALSTSMADLDTPDWAEVFEVDDDAAEQQAEEDSATGRRSTDSAPTPEPTAVVSPAPVASHDPQPQASATTASGPASAPFFNSSASVSASPASPNAAAEAPAIAPPIQPPGASSPAPAEETYFSESVVYFPAYEEGFEGYFQLNGAAAWGDLSVGGIAELTADVSSAYVTDVTYTWNLTGPNGTTTFTSGHHSAGLGFSSPSDVGVYTGTVSAAGTFTDNSTFSTGDVNIQSFNITPYSPDYQAIGLTLSGNMSVGSGIDAQVDVTGSDAQYASYTWTLTGPNGSTTSNSGNDPHFGFFPDDPSDIGNYTLDVVATCSHPEYGGAAGYSGSVSFDVSPYSVDYRLLSLQTSGDALAGYSVDGTVNYDGMDASYAQYRWTVSDPDGLSSTWESGSYPGASLPSTKAGQHNVTVEAYGSHPFSGYFSFTATSSYRISIKAFDDEVTLDLTGADPSVPVPIEVLGNDVFVESTVVITSVSGSASFGHLEVASDGKSIEYHLSDPDMVGIFQEEADYTISDIRGNESSATIEFVTTKTKKSSSGTPNINSTLAAIPAPTNANDKYWFVIAAYHKPGGAAQGLNGHSWCAIIDKEAGTIISAGLYPAFEVSASSSSGPGAIQDDSGTQFTNARAYKITSGQYLGLKATIEAEQAAPPGYDLQDNNCTHYAMGKAAAAGVGLTVASQVINFDPANNDPNVNDFRPEELLEAIKSDGTTGSVLLPPPP